MDINKYQNIYLNFLTPISSNKKINLNNHNYMSNEQQQKLKENTSKTCWTNKNNNNKSSMRNQF